MTDISFLIDLGGQDLDQYLMIFHTQYKVD